MANKIQFKRGLGNQIPELAYGEPGFVSDEEELYIGTENGNIKLTSKSEIENINTQIDTILLLVAQKKFNIKADGTDETEKIQAYCDYLMSMPTLNNGNLILPSGTLGISKPITISKHGWYPKIIGQGIAKTVICALQSMEEMFILGGNSDEAHSRIVLEHMTFNGKLKAKCCVNAKGVKYSTIQFCEFINVAENGYAVKWGDWCNRFINNTIRLSDSNITQGEKFNVGIANALYIDGIPNNFVIEKNTFSSCLNAVVLDGGHDIQIINNTFDICEESAIYCTSAVNNLTINGNYFEWCGTKYKSIQKPSLLGNDHENVQGAIILKGNRVMINEPFYNVNIMFNEFANCGKESILAISHIKTLCFEKNDLLYNYKYDNIVSLFGIGCLNTFDPHCYIELNNNVNYKNIILDKSTSSYRTRTGIVTKIKNITNHTNNLIPLMNKSELSVTVENNVLNLGNEYIVTPNHNVNGFLRFEINIDRNFFKNTVLNCKGKIKSENGSVSIMLNAYNDTEVTTIVSSTAKQNSLYTDFKLDGAFIPENCNKLRLQFYNENSIGQNTFSVKDLIISNI